MEKSKEISVMDLILRKFDQEVSEILYPASYVNRAKTLEEALLQYDVRPNMDGI